ncbi:MAG: MDR family MFS transporter [Candidatus Woesebacteria bacterium]|jgi:EmrB/QacA subfamily drug resistance transporter
MLHHISKREKIIIMIAVMSSLFLAALDQTIVGTALPKILTEFNALKDLSWVITAYMLTSTIAVPVAGKLSDLFGRRRMLMAGVAIFVLGSMLCGASQNILQLILFRALQGLGGGVIFSNAFTVIGDIFTPRERGKWQGVFGAVFGISSVIGPLLGGLLTDGPGWRWTFYINVPIGIAAFTLIARYLPTITHKVKEKIDVLGAILISAGLAGLVLACALGGTDGWAWSSPQIIGMIIGAFAILVAFIFVERKAESPILPLDLFRQSIFNVTAIAIFLFGIGFLGTVIYIPLFAQDILNFSATNSGIIILPMVAGLTITSMVCGRVVAKTGKYKIMYCTGLAIAGLGILLLSFLNATSSYFDMAWRMFVAGAGIGISMPLFTLVVQNAFDKKHLGVATSSVQLFRSMGGTVGTAILGGVLNNVLINKLGNIQNDPFVQIAKQSGGESAEQFSNIDINAVQGILSTKGQESIFSSLSQLPAQVQQTAIDAFNSFSEVLRVALSDSITRIFLVSSIFLAIAVVVSLFLKEIPLKHHNEEDIPPLGDA